MPAKKTATPDLPPVPATPDLPPVPMSPPAAETKSGTVRVKHKKTGNEYTVTQAYFEQYKSILEQVQ